MPIRSRSPEQIWQLAEDIRSVARGCTTSERRTLMQIADEIEDEGNRRDRIAETQPDRDRLLSNIAQFIAGSGDRAQIRDELSHDIAWFAIHLQPHLFQEDSHDQPDPR